MAAEIGSVLGVFAHPDDESLAAGGLLARAAAAGARTQVVSATWTSSTERGDELRHALTHLGVGGPKFLGYADAKVPHSAPDAPRLLDASLDEAVGRLVGLIREFQPQRVVTHDPYGGLTGHPDHLHTYRITCLAVEAAGLDMSYPRAGHPWPTPELMLATHPVSRQGLMRKLFGEQRALFTMPDHVVTHAIDVGPWLDLKVAAILAHKSEVRRGVIASLSEDEKRQLLSTEWFIRRAADQGPLELG